MLKGIHPAVSPELLGVLARMGHGDTIAVVDRNYPAYSTNDTVLRLDMLDTTTAAEIVLGLLPLDTFVERPVERRVPDDGPDDVLPAHAALLAVAETAEGRTVRSRAVARTDFYARARAAAACVVTSDDRPFACFLLTKGVLR